MLRTVLLMDGSEAMNSSSDYLPNYLLAMRPPLLRLVEKYLDSTPLASLGIVVMRDGVSHRLLPCTTNRNEIVDVLERDIFLHGGSGAMSLENGLRMAMSELVDMRKVAAAAAASRSANGSTSGKTAALTHKDIRAAWKGSATQLNILLVSAAVTLIDPTDVFSVVNTLAALSVHINVVSLVGAVHVFDVCAVETGGTLYCPLNYDHLMHIVDELATAHRAHAAAARGLLTSRRQGKRRRSAVGQGTESGDGVEGGSSRKGEGEDDADAPYLIPIGCPVYIEAPPASDQQQQQQQKLQDQSNGSSTTAASYYLACPQCHLIQLSVPTTCPLCRLLLCSAPMLYSTYVSHNSLVPAAKKLRVVQRVAPSSPPSGAVKEPSNAQKTTQPDVVEATNEQPVRCSLCMTRIPAAAAATLSQKAASSSLTSTNGVGSVEGPRVWQCESCASFRCDACNDFVNHTIGMCPHCLALR